MQLSDRVYKCDKCGVIWYFGNNAYNKTLVPESYKVFSLVAVDFTVLSICLNSYD